MFRISRLIKKLPLSLCLFGLGLLLVFLTSCCCMFGTCPASFPEVSTPTKPEHFILVGTADLQGRMDAPPPPSQPVEKAQAVGGIARIAVLFKLMKSAVPGHVITVSTGDDLMGPYFHTFKGKAIFTLMTRAGYDVFVPGNHEFDRGPAIFAQALNAAGFTCLCSDLTVQGTPLEGKFRPYLLKKYGNVQFGFFSLMTEGLGYESSPGPVRLKADNITVARQMVSLLRRKGAEVIIALTHVGTKRDREIARHVAGIDIIFGGHSHRYLKKMLRVGKTIIVNGGEQGDHLAKLDFFVSPDGMFLPGKTIYTLVPVNNTLQPDPEIESLLDTYKKSLPKSLVLGTTKKPWDLCSTTLRRSESGIADLLNDLLRKKFKVDVVLNNSGAFRGKKVYPPGNITNTMLQEINEFRNYAYILDIRGRYLRQILERSASSYGKGGFLQVSGLRYTINLSRPKQVLFKKPSGKLSIVKPGHRITHIEIQNGSGKWVPLDPERTYRVLTNNFLVEHEGDGYFWFRRYGKNMRNTYCTYDSILSEYVQRHHEVSPPEPDGRIKIVP